MKKYKIIDDSGVDYNFLAGFGHPTTSWVGQIVKGNKTDWAGGSIIVEKLCSEEFVDHRENMLYKTYGRRDRQDEVSAILVNDVIATRNFSFWKK